MITSTVLVGDFLPLDTIPTAGNLSLKYKKSDLDALASALGIQPDTFAAALVNIKGPKLETVWLCKDDNPFQLTAAYCLFKHEQQLAA